MLSIDLFATQFEKKLHEGALDDTITRTQAHLMEPLSRRAAEILTQIRSGKLTGAELDKLEKEYEDLVQQRRKIMLDLQPKNEQQVPSKQDPFAYVKPEPRGIGDVQDPQQKMSQLKQKAKTGPLANVAAGLKAFIKGEPEPMDEEQELGRRGIGMSNMKALQSTVEKGFARTIFQFPNIKYVIGEDDVDKMADYYNGQDAAGRTNFVYNVLGDGMKFVQLCRELGIQATPVEPQQPELPGMPQASPQGQLPLQEKKKSNSDDLEAGDVKVARELQKLRAQYPATNSDVEAVASAEIDSTERSQRQLAAIRGANEKQDALLKQLVALDQDQGREIDGLDKENNSLEQRLAQVQATNDRLQQAVGTMTGTKKSSQPAVQPTTSQPADNVINLIPGAPADQQKVEPRSKLPAQPVAQQPATSEPVPAVPAPELRSTVIPLSRYSPPKKLVKLQKAAESQIKEHGGGIGPKKHWQSMMPEGQPQELINRYLAIDAETDVEAVRAAIQAISKDPVLGANSKSRLLGQIGMIIRRHRLPIGRSYYTYMQQYMEDINETALNPKDLKGDYEAKRRALHDLSLNKDVDQAAVLQRRLDLDREARAKGLAETVTNVKAGMAEIYRRLAPKIERHRDSFLAGQLYDELENYAELHGAEREFKQMMNSARNRAHMEYDTNPGGFHNWFWFLPFEDESLDEIDRRGFLKGLGATAGLAAMGGVKAATSPDDPSWRKVGQSFDNSVTTSDQVKQVSGQQPTLSSRIANVKGPNAKGEYLVTVIHDDDIVSDYVTKNPPKSWMQGTHKAYPQVEGMAESTDDIKKRMSKLEALALAANRAGDDAKCKMYQQKIQSLKQKLSQSMSEGAKPGEYYIHTVYFKDGTKKRVRVTSDEFDVTDYYNKRGQAVDRVDYDFQLHSDMTEAEKEPTTRQELLNRVDKIQRMMTQDRNPANLQILRKELEMLKQRYQHLREDSDGGEAVEMAIMRRMLIAHTDLIVEFGLDRVVAAIEEVAYDVGDVDEIGSSDVSGWVHQVKQILGVDA